MECNPRDRQELSEFDDRHRIGTQLESPFITSTGCQPARGSQGHGPNPYVPLLGPRKPLRLQRYYSSFHDSLPQGPPESLTTISHIAGSAETIRICGCRPFFDAHMEARTPRRLRSLVVEARADAHAPVALRQANDRQPVARSAVPGIWWIGGASWRRRTMS